MPAVVADPLGRRAGADREPFPGEHRFREFPDLGFLHGQRPGQCLQHGHLGAEPGEHLRHLGADRAAAQHDQRFRHLFGFDGLPVGPVRRPGQPRDRRH
jgi:hypothetical protein